LRGGAGAEMTEALGVWTYWPRRWGTAFFRWWITGLEALLPHRLRRALVTGGHRWLLTLEGETVALTRVTEGHDEAVGRYPLKGATGTSGMPLRDLGEAREVILSLPEDQTLVQRLSLPAAVEDKLRGVLGYMMDRNTPFQVEEVYYDGRVTARNRDRGTIEVELSVAPRGFVDKTLDELKALGLQPDRVSVGCADRPGFSPVNLLPPERRRRRFRSRRLVNAALALIATVLAVALVALPLWEKRQVIRSLEAELGAVGEEVRTAQQLRDDLGRLTEEASFLVGKRRSTPLALAVLNELTHLLPDDTWIKSLRMRGGELQLNGFSAASAALIPILDASPFFRNVRFLSPVTRDRATDAERFHLAVELALEQTP
jgi:general secretion pathway protein L